MAAVVTFNPLALRRSVMLGQKTGGGLPAGYRQVEYLQSSGTQYIDISDTLAEYEFEITATLSQKRTNNAMLTGGELNSDVEGFAAFQLVNYVSVRRRDGTDDLTKDAYIAWADANGLKLRYICTQAYGEIVNADTGVSLAKNTAAVSYIYPTKVRLFHGYSSGTYASRYVTAKIYGAKYFLSGALAYDLVPCVRTADGEPGMYDRIGGTFYTNDGTGDFIIPT